MRIIDADALTEFFKARMALWSSVDEVLDEISDAPTIEAIPVDWMLQRMNETSSGSGMNIELNNALFTVAVEWERWKND